MNVTLPNQWTPREQAAAAGAKTFHGNPCRKGHGTMRYVRGATCVQCDLLRATKWQSDNPKRHGEFTRQWATENPERKAALNAKAWQEFYPKNAEARRQYCRGWSKDNRGHVAAYQSMRYATKKRRTPAWAEKREIEVVYRRCAEITAQTGIEHEVDHIVPLHGRRVSGLHVHHNLQVITAEANLLKGNRF